MKSHIQQPADQELNGQPNRQWDHDLGYYVDNPDFGKARGAPSGGIVPNPYSGIGLRVIFVETGGLSQEFRTKAEEDGIRLAGSQESWTLYFQANAQADPAWNSGITQLLVNGATPDQIIAGLKTQGAKFEFDAGALAAAKAEADSL